MISQSPPVENVRLSLPQTRNGWPRTAFWPHGGHLFCLQVAAALGLGGAEVSPLCFQPFGGYGDDMVITGGGMQPPTIPGIGFELKRNLHQAFKALRPG